MERRVGLAIVVLGALSAIALAQSQSVVTLPLRPPPQKEAEDPAKQSEPAAKPAPKPANKQSAAVSVKPAEPLAPQALFTLPPPAFTTEPLFPTGLALDPESLPPPEIDPAMLEAKQEPAAAPPPLPKPKPAEIMAKQEASPAAPGEARPPRRGEMEPIDDYRPAPRSAVIIDPDALDHSLLLSNDKPAATPPAPRPKPDMPALKEEAALAGAAETRPLRRGEMEPIDDYRPGRDKTALVRASQKPAKTATPQPKPPAPKPNADKESQRADMMPVDDIPGGKLYKAGRGKATTFRCFVRDVMAFYDRTHVRCYNKAKGKLFFFAVDTNQPISAALVSKGLAAMQAGQAATITFAPEADLNPANCAPANCRRLIDIQN